MDGDPPDADVTAPEGKQATEDEPIDGSTRHAASLAELRDRVVALEAEQARLLARYAADMEAENARLRSRNPSVSRAPSSTEPMTAPAAPPYIARALVAVENHLADMERYIALGDEAAVARSKVAAATRTCSILRQLCDDDAFLALLMSLQTPAGEHAGGVAQKVSEPAFRKLEMELLELAGLSEQLATQHVDAAIDAFKSDPTGSLNRLHKPMLFLGDVRKLRDASCVTADLLAQGLRQQQSRQRWKKLLTFGLGGTLIVTANTVASTVLGDAGVAGSAAIGSGAVGVATQLVS